MWHRPQRYHCRNYHCYGYYFYPLFASEVVGSQWRRRVQVDVVVVNRQSREMLLGECKWGEEPVGRQVGAGADRAEGAQAAARSVGRRRLDVPLRHLRPGRLHRRGGGGVGRASGAAGGPGGLGCGLVGLIFPPANLMGGAESLAGKIQAFFAGNHRETSVRIRTSTRTPITVHIVNVWTRSWGNGR
jgi:hypothetical protein